MNRICTKTTAMAFLLGLFCNASTYGWEREERFGNVPFYRGSPMVVQKRSMLFSPANQVELRLAGDGWFKPSLSLTELDERAAVLINAWTAQMPQASGVRDERYFLISIDPDVVIISPFMYEFQHKTKEQIRGLAGRLTSEVLNPMYHQLQAQQHAALSQGLAEGLFARTPNPNFVEVGCAFPDLSGSILWAPSMLGGPVSFDADARNKLERRLGLIVRRHPRISDYWQVAGCPT